MQGRLLTAGALALAVVLLFSVNMVADSTLGGARFDLTQNKLYTLSAGTRHILSQLEEPITLRFYLSQHVATRLPSVNAYASRVKELLQEYARKAHGKIRLHIIDPEPFSPEEDRAVGYGLRGLPVNSDQDVLYFGLVGTSSTDQEQAIPIFSRAREHSLEYDITKLIYNLAHPKHKVVGVLSTLPIDGQGPQARLRGLTTPPWAVMQQMRQLFDVHTFNKDLTSIPKDVNVLMLVHPKGLPPAALYAVDQYVLRGGHLLVFVDPNAETETGVGRGYMTPGSALHTEADRMLEAWGVKLDRKTVVGDLNLALKVQMQRGARLITFDYPVWMDLPPTQFNHKDIITSNLGDITMGSPGRLITIPGATTHVTTLIHTTDKAALFPAKQVAYGQDPQSLLRNYKPAGKVFDLAVRITGPAKTAFPDGPPKPKDGKKASTANGGKKKEPPAPQLKASKGGINVIVVADTDLLQDHFWVNVRQVLGTQLAVPTAANGTFVVNALDNLTGSSDLISVRNRGSYVRPFERIKALQKEAEVKFRDKEQELVRKLNATEQKLGELQQGKPGQESVILTSAQQNELTRFRQEKLRIRKELRSVRRQLREDIKRLESRIKFIDIALVPIVVGIGGLLVAAWRIRRRRLSIHTT